MSGFNARQLGSPDCFCIQSVASFVSCCSLCKTLADTLEEMRVTRANDLYFEIALL